MRGAAGKSAVLTGLVVCLGGRAHITDRGHSMKDFIKNGERYGERISCAAPCLSQLANFYFASLVAVELPARRR